MKHPLHAIVVLQQHRHSLMTLRRDDADFAGWIRVITQGFRADYREPAAVLKIC